MMKLIPIEKHHTTCIHTTKPNGVMMPLWKDYVFPSLKPAFVYYSTLAPKTTKGPYTHTKRSGLLCFIKGAVLLVIKSKKDYEKHIIDADQQPQSIYIPKSTPYILINNSNKEAALINICDYAWRPNDNETQPADFSDYPITKRLGESHGL